jgi:hypothetical protein
MSIILTRYLEKNQEKPQQSNGLFSLGQTRSREVEKREPALLTTSGYMMNNTDKKDM